MKRYTHTLFALSLMWLLLLPTTHAAVSLGSIQPVKAVEARPGQQLELKVYLFNLGPPQQVMARLELPTGWQGWVEPDQFTLTSSIDLSPRPGYEYVKLAGIEGYVRLVPVRVGLIVPPVSGTYRITLSVSALSPTEGIGTAQERKFRFDVSVGPAHTEPAHTEPAHPTSRPHEAVGERVWPSVNLTNPTEKPNQTEANSTSPTRPPLLPTGAFVYERFAEWDYVLYLVLGLLVCVLIRRRCR